METKTKTEQEAVLASVVTIFATLEEAREVRKDLLSRVQIVRDSISENEWRLPSGPALISGRWEMI